MQEIEVVVAHHERATLRVSDVFLKTDGVLNAGPSLSHPAGNVAEVSPTCPCCRMASPTSPCFSCVRIMRRAETEDPPALLDSCRAALVYDGPARMAILALKFRDGRRLVPWLADVMVLAWQEQPYDVDVLTWVPAHAVRSRGFDQGAALARAVGRRLGVPARRLLRSRAGPGQTGASGLERRAGPDIRPPRSSPESVLIVDDVWTTGASLSAAARALKQSGCRSAYGLTVGRTLLKPPLSVAETLL